MQTSNFQKCINLCHFKLLNLWEFVTAATENLYNFYLAPTHRQAGKLGSFIVKQKQGFGYTWLKAAGMEKMEVGWLKMQHLLWLVSEYIWLFGCSWVWRWQPLTTCWLFCANRFRGHSFLDWLLQKLLVKALLSYLIVNRGFCWNLKK